MRVKYIFLILLAFVFGNLFSQTPDAGKIDELMNKYYNQNLFSGTVLVAKDGNIIYEKAFGYADYESKIPNETGTRFNLCSIGKTFTAVLIMQLVESGKLSLTEPIAAYLPEYKIPNKDKITIHHLLTHTSGLFNYMAHPDYRNTKGSLKSIDDVMKLVEDQKLVFDTPGEKMSYSNSGFIVLGKIIEKTTGKTYADYLKEKILDPLNMTNTILPVTGQVIPNNANGYKVSMERKVMRTNTNVPAFSDGGLHTTAEDMLKYDRALYGTMLLKEETKDLMFAGGSENLEKYKTSSFTNYSYGWGVRDVMGRRQIGHSGGIEGINTLFIRFPSEKITIIILSNYDGAADYIARNLRAVVFGDSPEPVKLPLSFFIYDNIKEKGPKYLSENFDNLIKENGYRLDNDQVLNMLGYNFMEENMINEAIEIFKINARLYPDVANCFDSLGEAYLKSGDKENARINYEKVLVLDPNNKNVEKILQQLK